MEKSTTWSGLFLTLSFFFISKFIWGTEKPQPMIKKMHPSGVNFLFFPMDL